MKALRSVLPGWLAARIFAVSGWADVTGTILGVVRDQSGGVVPNVEIKATHLETNQTRPTRTDTAGEYRILALPAGKYRIEAAAEMLKDCPHSLDYPHLRSEIRIFWTDQHLYLLFCCPYKKLDLFLPPRPDRPRNKLWDRDVVEVFLGSDWNRITHYREFEIAPTEDWIDLAIDLDRKSYDRNWRFGGVTAAPSERKSPSLVPSLEDPAEEHLYRIEGQGPDSKGHFLCWQPTLIGIPVENARSGELRNARFRRQIAKFSDKAGKRSPTASLTSGRGRTQLGDRVPPPARDMMIFRAAPNSIPLPPAGWSLSLLAGLLPAS